MRKQIHVSEVRVGMFIDQLAGSWLSHPFWKSAFLVTTADQLAQLAASAIKQVWIDTDKGLDVALEPAPIGQEEARSAPPCVPEAPAATVSDPHACSLQAEISRASHIVAQAGPAMRSMFQDARLGKAVDAEHCLPLVDDITRSVQRNPGALVSLARLKTSDDYTYLHSVAVCALMVSLARQLGLSEAQTREAGLGGLVHDLGKAMMPQDVLNKPGKLTADEYTVIKGHPRAGHQMLVEARGVGPVPLDICLHHHERIDGKGYPFGLKGDDISLYARMGAVCDVYDAITSNRPYKAGWDPAEALQKMAQWAQEGQFDNRIFQAFVRSIGIYPTGALVKLRSGRLAVVVEQGGDSLLSPVVRAFYDTVSRQPFEPELVLLADPACADEIVSRESAEAWELADLERLWMVATPQP